MPETELKDRLQALLAAEGITIQVVEQDDQLLVILNRSEAAHPDYTTIIDQVVDEIELSLMPVQSIQFYSRVLGKHEPDWARTVPLGSQGTGNATVIVSSARSAPTVIETPPEEDISTKLVPPPVTQVIEDGSTTTIEEEEFNLPKPNIRPSKIKPKRPKPAPTPPVVSLPEEPTDNSAATEVARIVPKPQPKPPEPIIDPVPAPFPVQNVILGIVVIGSIITIGWFVWSKTRPQSKPKPKKSQVVIILPGPFLQS